MQHISVLKKDVENYLALQEGDTVVDGTLGLGGHAKGILDLIGKKGLLISFEQDERNLRAAKENLRDYGDQIIYIKDNFCYLKTRITGKNIDQVDAVLLDLGLSSPHIDDEKRGFSFMKEGPLDMRFDSDAKLTAAVVVNTYSEEDLADIFFHYGEERASRKVARQICERRKSKPFESTLELANFLEEVLPKKRLGRTSKSHPATKIFQAIRIEVNDELNVLKEVLPQIMEILKPGGRVVIISYHSLEDRIVKQFFRSLERPPATPEQSVYQNHGDPLIKNLTKKPVVPSPQELEQNPRSRSAKLRAYEKL